jgi:crotonobetainyl-CoA:carnitine CoA-transferase CaiB-like acyl-CoA transferase
LSPDPAATAAPLTGLRVLDCSRVLAGPFATMILGDLGAEVIKVEHPRGGDDTRAWGPPSAGGESAYYLSINRNKRSLALDLKTAAGRAILRRLAGVSDVLVENFRRGTMASWGLDYATLAADRPGLVYCTISGYGPEGPQREKPGYDFVVQAASGLMSISGPADGEPSKLGVAIVDILTGLFAADAILAGLLGRTATGRGIQIEVSLLESALAALINVGQNYLVTGSPPRRYGNAHPNIVPYQTFAAADGWLAVAVGNDKQFAALCAVLGDPALAADPQFADNPARVTHRTALVSRLAEDFLARPMAYWVAALEGAGVPVGPVQTVAEVLDSPQVQALGLVREVDHPTAGRLRLIGSPLRLNGAAPPIRYPPPLLGQHSAAILTEVLSLSPAEIAALAADGVIAGNEG